MLKLDTFCIMRFLSSPILRHLATGGGTLTRTRHLSTDAPSPRSPTPRVSSIVDEVSGLTLLELADLTNLLRSRLGVEQLPSIAVMAPGATSAASAASYGDVAATEEPKEEKTAFDLKLESFEASAKIKVIKEVRSFTDLGLKEAKELVEKAPAILKSGVVKEDAEKIVEKMKEIGAKVVME